MSQVLDEVQEAISRLNLVDKVTRIPEQEEAKLYADLLAHFVSGKDRRWWWESFKSESRSCTYHDGQGFKLLGQFVPDADEDIWFMVEDDQLPNYPIFEATANEAMMIIGECFGFEYYLIPKSKAWLLCEDHHDRIIWVGAEVVQRMPADAI